METNYTIRVDFQVWQALQARRENEAMTENAVLRGLLGLPQLGESPPPPPPPPPGGPRKLKVTFADGKVLQDGQVVSTFVRAIEKIGAERVRQLRIPMCGKTLVEDRPGDRPGQWKQLTNGCHVNTGSSTGQKFEQLERIRSALGGFRVELV